MVDYETIKAVARRHAVGINTHYALRVQQSDRAACNAIEYAVSKALSRPRDVWRDALVIPAADFFRYVEEYYSHRPSVDRCYTSACMAKVNGVSYLKVDFV